MAPTWDKSLFTSRDHLSLLQCITYVILEGADAVKKAASSIQFLSNAQLGGILVFSGVCFLAWMYISHLEIIAIQKSQKETELAKFQTKLAIAQIAAGARGEPTVASPVVLAIMATKVIRVRPDQKKVRHDLSSDDAGDDGEVVEDNEDEEEVLLEDDYPSAYDSLAAQQLLREDQMEAGASKEFTPAETTEAALYLSESSYIANPTVGDQRGFQKSTDILNDFHKIHGDGQNATTQPPAQLSLDKLQSKKRGREPSSAEASNKGMKQPHGRVADDVKAAKLRRRESTSRKSIDTTEQHRDKIHLSPDDSPAKEIQFATSKDRQPVPPKARTTRSMKQKQSLASGITKDQLITASENGADIPPPDQVVRRKRGRPKAIKNSSTAEPIKSRPKESFSAEHQLRSSNTTLESPDRSQKPGHKPTKLPKVQSIQAHGIQAKEIARNVGQDEDGRNVDLQEQQPSEPESQQLKDTAPSSGPRLSAESEDGVDNTAGDVNDRNDDLEENTQHSDGARETPLARLELFGQEDAWETVTKAARKVCKSRVGIKPSSKTVRHFCNRLGEATKIYRDCEANTNTDKHNLTRLNKILDRLDLEISGFRKSNARPGKKVKVLLDDLYSYGIPGMVTLLEGAMAVQSKFYSALDDLDVLKEIIRIQDITIALCQTVKHWRTTPKLGGVPFVKEIERQILPYLRDVRLTFQNELDTHHDEIRQLRQIEARERRRLNVIEETQRSRQEQNEIIEEKRRKTYEDILRNKMDMKILLGSWPRSRLTVSPSHRRTFATADSWTKEQDRELVHQLRILRYLPVEQRYMRVLNTPLLQNKLPEHIRQRTLYYKPYMEMTYTEVGKEVPDWVSSLE
ncbi:MAG: hypothetical protein Q9187_003629 [Circinaria calcarea]